MKLADYVNQVIGKRKSDALSVVEAKKLGKPDADLVILTAHVYGLEDALSEVAAKVDQLIAVAQSERPVVGKEDSTPSNH